jgi:DNA-binding NarL/FixJ family response regulator
MSEDRVTRVLLVDDHNLVRAGVRKIIEGQPGFEVVGEFGNGEQALQALETMPVDVVVLDLTMPTMDGFEVLRRAKEQHPSVRILVLSMHANAQHVTRAVREGADGYLLKDSAVQELVAALESVMDGRAYYSPSVQQELSNVLRAGSALGRPKDLLTDRELDVLKLVARGLSTKEIASRLDISPRTVDSHRANLMRKLGLRSVALLTHFALSEGLLETP